MYENLEPVWELQDEDRVFVFGIWRNSAGGHRYQRQRKWLLTDERRQGLNLGGNTDLYSP